jgi:DNA-binding beta-propeller fold protein YncE
MTTPDMTPEPGAPEASTPTPEAATPTADAAAPAPETALTEDAAVADATAAAVAGAAVEDPEEKKRRRRKAGILLLLASLLGVFVLFTGWYLINRKPVTELPLPPIGAESIPHYAYSLYGVTAPTGVAVSPDGSRVYVTQTEGDRTVVIFDGNGTQLAAVKPPASTGSDHVPVYVALNPTNGDLYVSDRPTGSIYVYSADGVYRTKFDPGKTLVGWQPLGMAFTQQGDLYVTDVSGPFNRVHEFGPDGQLVRTIGEAGQFNFPNGVAVDSDRNVYVTDSNNGRLVVFDPSGQQRAVVRRGAAEGDLGLPRGTAIDDSGRIYVVDTTAQGVQLYHVLGTEDRSPKYIGRFGIEGTQDGAFQYPNGVAVDTRARIYVTDWRNNRVQVWTY